MLLPPYLKQGDKVAIVATARKITHEEIKPALQTLESWGLQVVLGGNLFKVDNQYAGTDEQRCADLQTMLDDKSIKAIIFARGGYGTVRIVDNLDFTIFKENPKWLCGYSDITVLHSHIHTQFNIPTIHSVMLSGFGNAVAENTLKQALFGELNHYHFPADNILNKQGTTEGVLVGGNLSLLYALLGSASDIDTDGKILFIEDLDEMLYHIDRMMINLKRNGKLKGLKGLIVGGMTAMKDNDVPFGKTAEAIIAEHVAEYDFPIVYNFPTGHIEDNNALMLGVKVRLEIDNNCILSKIN